MVLQQDIAIIPSFKLESGVILKNFPVAYKTWGCLNSNKTNAMVICHALTGSSDVTDWWGPLIGNGRAFDTSRFFIVCLNSLGSPYGSASPVTNNSETGRRYGPEFPLVSIRDDVNIHKLILDDLGVKQIATVIGGSMGGMLVMEYAFFGIDYVRTIIPLATSARHSAWCISWGEAQRQSIYSDPKYDDGYYSLSDAPLNGLGAARMAALLTYRSRNSFEKRFGREVPNPNRFKTINGVQFRIPTTPEEENWLVNNHGIKNGKRLSISSSTSSTISKSNSCDSISSISSSSTSNKIQYFSAQSYLRYQADKFVKRFDSNCYIAITRKLDSHDISRDRFETIEESLRSLEQQALIIGIESDGLFTYTEQELIAKYMPNGKLAKIDSPEGHDAFLLEFSAVNKLIVEFLKENCSDIMQQEGVKWEENDIGEQVGESLFGEAEDGVTNW